MKRKPQAWLVMWLVAMSAAFLLGATNEITADMIEQHGFEEKQRARSAVFLEAEDFTPLPIEASDTVQECYAAKKDGKTVGYVCTVNTKGYGGPIEVIAGLTPDGEITGITVGGSSFSETAGLGAKTRESDFTEQFAGKRAPLSLKMDIDAVTGASISSGAVVNAVNDAADFIKGLAEVSAE